MMRPESADLNTATPTKSRTDPGEETTQKFPAYPYICFSLSREPNGQYSYFDLSYLKTYI